MVELEHNVGEQIVMGMVSAARVSADARQRLAVCVLGGVGEGGGGLPLEQDWCCSGLCTNGCMNEYGYKQNNV